ncbi:glycosyltransferase [Subtercola sp. YIM 133946]|uniref:glycosyltransferase n=1 Tax=Subtercola sp. YIM 133946 TaxID=3118909 RepID=UPI002F93CC6E
MLLVASTGGHLAQLVRLAPGLGASDDSVWVTFENSQSISLLAGKRVVYVPYVRPRDLRGAIGAARILREVMKSEHFDLVVSTGAAIAVSALPMARLRGLRTLYIESVSRVHGPSLSGRIIALTHAAELRTQHPSWADSRWTTQPSVFSAFTRVRRQKKMKPTIFVTLGTIEGYRFDAMIDRVLATGLADESTVWQLGSTTGRTDLPGTVRQEMSSDEFENYARAADVVLTHAGVGTMLGLLDMGIYPVLITRRKHRNEHVDDHQTQIAALANELEVALAVDALELDRDGVIEASGWTIVPNLAQLHT